MLILLEGTEPSYLKHQVAAAAIRFRRLWGVPILFIRAGKNGEPLPLLLRERRGTARKGIVSAGQKILLLPAWGRRPMAVVRRLVRAGADVQLLPPLTDPWRILEEMERACEAHLPTPVLTTDPARIEEESLRRIEARVPPASVLGVSELERKVILRMVHATADVSISREIRFSRTAVESAIASLRQRKPIFTDVRMAQAGISRRLGNEVFCPMEEPGVAEGAKQAGITRSAFGMRQAAEKMEGAIVAIGNAPTALLELVRLVEEGKARPALIVGVPVGLIQAVEAKRLLAGQSRVPYLTNLSRRGGTPMAVSAVNALIGLAG